MNMENLTKSVEKRFLDEVKKYKMIEPDDTIIVAISGGKDSLTVLYLVKKNFKNKIIALSIDEGIKDEYRTETLNRAVHYAKEWSIEHKIVKFTDEFGAGLQEIIVGKKELPCSICGVLRRYLINKWARKLGGTKLIGGYNLDDEVQSILMNIFQNDVQKLVRLGAIAGLFKHEKFIPRVKPLRKVTEKETKKFVLENKILVHPCRCPNAHLSFRGKIRKILNDYEEKYPGTKLRILEEFDNMLPELQKKFKDVSMGTCIKCGEPASSEVCKACVILNETRN